MELLFWIGFLLTIGYISRVIINKFSLPSVTVYILIGIALSPSTSNILSNSFVKSSEWMIDITLAVIAFIIGGSVQLKKIGKSKKLIGLITIFQAQMAFFLTSSALYFILPFFVDNPSNIDDKLFFLVIALFLGALASTTAPATTLAIIDEYKSKGIMTTTLIAVVAIDDILAIVNYAFAFSFNNYILGHSENSLLYSAYELFLHLFFSALLGVVFVYITIWIIQKVKNKSLISIGLGTILMVSTIAHFLGLEALLSIMTFGFVLSNKSRYFDHIFDELEKRYLDILFMLFFILSGAHIEIDKVIELWHIAIIYILFRATGKLSGAYIGASLGKGDEKIKKYLGFALLPQAGVALGLAMLIYKEFPVPEIGAAVFNIILAATVIHEILGPFATKYALKKSKEIK